MLLAACPRRRDTSLQALRLVSCLAQLRVASCRRRAERAHLLLELRDARRAPRELGLQFARLCVAAGELTPCARQVALALLDLALQLGRQPFEDQPAALGALQRLEVTEGPLALALQVAQGARGAGTILLRQPALLELQAALRARGAFLFPELALQLLGARTLSAQHSARLRHLLLGLHARTRQLIQLKRQFGTHLPELGVQLRGALLGGRARRIRRVAGAFGLRQARALGGEQLLRLVQLGRQCLLSELRLPSLRRARGRRRFGQARSRRWGLRRARSRR